MRTALTIATLAAVLVMTVATTYAQDRDLRDLNDDDRTHERDGDELLPPDGSDDDPWRPGPGADTNSDSNESEPEPHGLWFWHRFLPEGGVKPFVGYDLGAGVSDGPGFYGDNESAQFLFGLRFGFGIPLSTDDYFGGIDVTFMVANQFDAFGAFDLQIKFMPIGTLFGMFGTGRMFVSSSGVDFGAGGGFNVEVAMWSVSFGVDTTFLAVPGNVVPSGLIIDVRMYVHFTFF